MFNLFKNKSNLPNQSTSNQQNFEYLEASAYYFDSACQSLRPEQVIKAQDEYYHKFNSCGHRVKYKWGEQTDRKIEACRADLLSLTGKNDKKYTVAQDIIGLRFDKRLCNPLYMYYFFTSPFMKQVFLKLISRNQL
jgi:selenocysteine lyase/cysteine desulfurase